MLVYVRHGATSLNKGGKEERLRGWLSVPLAPKGEQQADAAGQQLAKMLPGLDSFETSDLHRAKQTADAITKHIGVPATPNPAIRDWNTGKLAGQKVEDVMPQLKALIKHPQEPAPEGERLQDYLNRFVPAMKAKVAAPGIHVVVGHARGATILEGIADPIGGKGGDINPKFLLERPRVQPGGILIIDRNWNTKYDHPSEGA